ncbi:glycosyltransferase family 4 protein [Parapedobacter koreensis]|uniref:Glycosyltransferase involved in cell wall bisynthesis n=1 Tax=Parapedobacter koreensis TaxID=332977 RepID=A0A1H7LPR8_9SPHI|nr:glycosyltransferase family 4 protein [Parapedobacter koreensis]SEL00839.1 Glycosyltransferase involved in cell wall bisynthesis [Parapedobacter koreensis]
MEVLFVSHKYPPATGGMEKQSFELIEGMRAYATVHQLVYTGQENILLFFLRLEKRIVELLNKYPSIALIHFNDALIGSLALRHHHHYPHVKKVVTVHGLDVVFPWGYYQRKILPLFNRFDRIVAVSEATKRAIVARGVSTDRVVVINNGVDHAFADLSQQSVVGSPEVGHALLAGQKPYFVMLGRPVKRKGFSWFLREVAPRLPDAATIVMAGPLNTRRRFVWALARCCPSAWRHLIALFLGYPSDEREIFRLLRQPSKGAKVTHLGKLPLADLQTLLQHASAFLMPNIPIAGDMEGFGLVCLEASGAGTLVVAAEIDGITDAVLHRRNGLLLPAADADAWVERLNHIMNHPTPYRGIAADFQQYTLQHFGWDKMCRAYASCFAALLE